MILEIDFNSDEAIYVQLRNQIIMGIACEEFADGESLPSVRQLAQVLGVNMHTVNKAYAILREEGYLKLDRRKGAVISVETLEKQQELASIQENLRMLVAEAVCKGVTEDEMNRLIHDMYQKLDRSNNRRNYEPITIYKICSKALNEGREIAGYLGFKDVSSIFVLLGLYGADGSLASEVLKMHGVTRELIEEAIKEKSKMPKDRRRTVMDTPKTEYLLEIAGELAMKYGCEAIGSEHILMAMIKDGDNEAFRFLEDHKISSEGIYTDILVTAGIDFRSAKNEYNEAISDGVIWKMEQENICCFSIVQI